MEVKVREQDKKKTKLDLRGGTKVEVSSDQEGFKGAWYEATIVEPPSSKRRRQGTAMVEYKALLAEDGHNPLVEPVEVSFIRPLPPRILENVTPFDVLEVVDAFYRDGWWKGVVTKAWEDEKTESWRYLVVFDDPPDQIVFSSSNLRYHWDWTNGKWVRPPKQQRMKGLGFSKGMFVEVNVDKGKPKHVWVPAVVLKEVGFYSFLVSLKGQSPGGKNEGEKKLYVDYFHIRPPPPNFEDKDLEPLEKVQAFYYSAWRDGFITRILPEGAYHIYLMNEKEEKLFAQSEVRRHLEFIGGKWVGYRKRGLPSIKAKKTKKDDELKGSIPGKAKEEAESPYPNSSKKSLKRQRKAQHVGSVIKDDSSPCLKKLKLKLKVGHSSNPLLSIVHEKLTPVDAPKGEGQCTNCIQTECPSQMVDSEPFTESEMPFRGKDAENRQEAGLDNEVIISAEKRGTQQNSQIKGEEDNRKADSSEGTAKFDQTTKDMDLSTSSAEGMRESLPEDFCKLNQEGTNQEVRMESEVICVEKTETLPSTQIEGQQIVIEAGEDNEKGNSAEATAEFDQITKGTNLSISAQGITELPSERPCVIAHEVMDQQKEEITSQNQKDGEEGNVARGNITEMDIEGHENVAVILTVDIVDSQGLLYESAETSALLPSSITEDVDIPSTGRSCATFTNGQLGTLCSEGNSPGKTLDHCNQTIGQGRAVSQYPVASLSVENDTVNMALPAKSCGTSTNGQPQTLCSEGNSPGMTVNHCSHSVERQCRLPDMNLQVENNTTDETLAVKSYAKSPINLCSEGNCPGMTTKHCSDPVDGHGGSPAMNLPVENSTVDETLAVKPCGNSPGMTTKLCSDSVEGRGGSPVMNLPVENNTAAETLAVKSYCTSTNAQPVTLCSEVHPVIGVAKTLNQCGTIIRSPVMSLPVENDTADMALVVNSGYQPLCSEGQCETIVQPSVIENEAENEGWPFVKFSSVWEKVESLEVFRFMPQKPHFRALAKCKEVCREGAAIGHMVTFASLAEKVSNLQITDPRTLFDSYLEGLAELEALGFDVKALVDCISRLLSIQDSQRQLEDQSNEVQTEIADHNLEKDKLEYNIGLIDKKISALQKERDVYILLKKKKACDISALELQAGAINEEISAAECDFRDLVAATWKMP